MKRIALILVVAALATASFAEPTPQYAALFINDAKSGHSRMVRTVDDGRVTTVTQTQLSLTRSGVSLQATIESRFVETVEGKPLEFSQTTQMAILGAITVRGVVTGDQMRVSSQGMTGTQETTVAYPPGALMPEGVRLLMKRQLAAKATSFTYTAFNPEAMVGAYAMPVAVTVGKRAATPLIGRTTYLTELVTATRMGGQSVAGHEWRDDNGEARKSSTSAIGMRMETIACDQAFAMSPNQQVDLIDGGSVASPVEIDAPRATQRAIFTVAPTGKDIKLNLPDTGEQHVKANPDGTFTVTVKPVRQAKGVRPYRGTDTEAVEMLKANLYIESDDRQIVRQAKRIVGDTTDALAAARKIETWVTNHITDKTLTVGYATAAATMTSKAGDCTEHAVLTAALCRAAGIPCRIVVGVAYTERFGQWEHRFIGHAWNQAYIGDTWVGLDASLGADASRIALTIGAGHPMDFVGIIHSLGNFKITKVKTERASR